jgi:hypothetical protein
MPPRPWTKAYNQIAEALLATATFAGTITYAIVLAPFDSNSATEQRPSYPVGLLAFAGSFFLGGAVGCISIFILCRAGEVDIEGEDNYQCIARLLFITIGCLIITAFGMLIGSLIYLEHLGASILGLVFLGIFSIIPAFVGIYHKVVKR